MTGLPAILLEKATPLELVRAHPHKARAMAQAAADTFGTASRIAARLVAPALDKASRDWQRNPHLAEIDAMATILGIAGVYALNACFEWGCTSGVWPSPEGPRLRRVLDWPFPRLGESTAVAWQEKERFYNIGWPGFAGVIQGLAPGRFAAAINQAPMRRHGKSYVGDWLANRILVRDCAGLPPAHLLRGIRNRARLCRRQTDVVRDRNRGPGNLPAGRHSGRRRLCDRAHRNAMRRARNGRSERLRRQSL